MSYFSDRATGVNSDIQRHIKKEQELTDMIAELEQRRETQMDEVVLKAYNNLLQKLRQSKAEVVAKIGRIK